MYKEISTFERASGKQTINRQHTGNRLIDRQMRDSQIGAVGKCDAMCNRQ